MLDSLMGNPHAVFFKEGHGKGYRYARVRSQNADWFQEFTGDKAKLRQAIVRQAAGRPLNPRRAEDRWLAEQTDVARLDGWHATFGGKESPIGIEPAEASPATMKLLRAHFARAPVRVYLAMPEQDVGRLRMRAAALHETPNLWMNHVLPEHLDRSDAADADESVPF